MVQAAPWATTYRAPNGLLSDTEDSVTGSQWHQQARGELADMLRDIAARYGASWGVCEWLSLIGLRHEDGTPYDPKPDVMVLREPLASGSLASVRLDQVGSPLFIAELAGDSTKRNDLGEKRAAYEAVGVPEYVVVDPDGRLLATPLIAWRLEGAVYVPWEPTDDGWWHSGALGASFRPGHPFLEVRDRDGIVLEPAGLVRRHARALERRLAEEVGERAALEHQLAETEHRLGEEVGQRIALERRLAEQERALADLTATLQRLQAQREGPD